MRNWFSRSAEQRRPVGAIDTEKVMCIARSIRDATVGDAQTLCQAERAVAARYPGLLVSLPDELEPSAFQQRISNAINGHGRYLVAEVNEVLVGHASLYPMERRQLAHVLRLDMCMHLGHWRQGHGRALMGRLLDWARTASEAHKIELLVRANNTPALALYSAFGFLEEGQHRDRVWLQNSRFVDDIAMALLLTLS
jgi:RimJ/RimL family protein N-acetyltransferase